MSGIPKYSDVQSLYSNHQESVSSLKARRNDMVKSIQQAVAANDTPLTNSLLADYSVLSRDIANGQADLQSLAVAMDSYVGKAAVPPLFSSMSDMVKKVSSFWIDTSGSSQVFKVLGGMQAPSGTVTARNLTATHGQDLATAKANVAAMKAVNMESRLTALEGALPTQSTQYSTLASNADSVYTSSLGVINSVSQLYTDASALQTRANNANTTVQTHASRIAAAGSTANTVSNNLQSLQANLAPVQALYSNQAAIITSMGNTLTLAENTVANVQSSVLRGVSTLTSGNSTVQTAQALLTSANASLTGFSANLASASVALTNVAVTHAYLQNVVASSNLTVLQTRTSNLSANLDTLESLAANYTPSTSGTLDPAVLEQTMANISAANATASNYTSRLSTLRSGSSTLLTYANNLVVVENALYTTEQARLANLQSQSSACDNLIATVQGLQANLQTMNGNALYASANTLQSCVALLAVTANQQGNVLTGLEANVNLYSGLSSRVATLVGNVNSCANRVANLSTRVGGTSTDSYLDIGSSLITTLTTSGTSTCSTAIKKVGNSSWQLNSNNASVRMGVPLSFWADPWCVEFFMYPTQTRTMSILGTDTDYSFRVDLLANNAPSLFIGNGVAASGVWSVANGVNAATALTINSWNHLALQFSGTQYTLMVNGSRQLVITSNVAPVAGTFVNGGDRMNMVIGSSNASVSCAGYFDALRMSSQIRYDTSTYTIPTLPYTTDAFTLLLQNFEGAQGDTVCPAPTVPVPCSGPDLWAVMNTSKSMPSGTAWSPSASFGPMSFYTSKSYLTVDRAGIVYIRRPGVYLFTLQVRFMYATNDPTRYVCFKVLGSSLYPSSDNVAFTPTSGTEYTISHVFDFTGSSDCLALQGVRIIPVTMSTGTSTVTLNSSYVWLTVTEL